MALGMEAGLGQGDVVLDGDPAPTPRKDHSSPHFSGHVCCYQTVAHLSYCSALTDDAINHKSQRNVVTHLRCDGIFNDS